MNNHTINVTIKFVVFSSTIFDIGTFTKMNFPTYIFIINVNLNCVVCLYAKLDKL